MTSGTVRPVLRQLGIHFQTSGAKELMNRTLNDVTKLVTGEASYQLAVQARNAKRNAEMAANKLKNQPGPRGPDVPFTPKPGI